MFKSELAHVGVNSVNNATIYTPPAPFDSHPVTPQTLSTQRFGTTYYYRPEHAQRRNKGLTTPTNTAQPSAQRPVPQTCTFSDCVLFSDRLAPHLSDKQYTHCAQGGSLCRGSCPASRERLWCAESLHQQTQQQQQSLLLVPPPQQQPLPECVLGRLHALVLLRRPHHSTLLRHTVSCMQAYDTTSGSCVFVRRLHDCAVSPSVCERLASVWSRVVHPCVTRVLVVTLTQEFGDTSLLVVSEFLSDCEPLPDYLRYRWQLGSPSSRFKVPDSPPDQSSTAPPVPQSWRCDDDDDDSSSQPSQFNDPFASAQLPRPYSARKAALERQRSQLLPESLVWRHVIQLTGLMRVLHARGLSTSFPAANPPETPSSTSSAPTVGSTMTSLLSTPKLLMVNRRSTYPHVSLTCLVEMHVLACMGTCEVTPQRRSSTWLPYRYGAPTDTASEALTSLRTDCLSVASAVLALACASSAPLQSAENHQTAVEIAERHYSPQLRRLLHTLSHTHTLDDAMPIIGSRFCTQVEGGQAAVTELEVAVGAQSACGQLYRTMCALSAIVERPVVYRQSAMLHANTWAETGDRYLLKLFRDHVFHSAEARRADGTLDVSRAHTLLCKLEAASPDSIALRSSDGHNVLVVTFSKLSACLEESFRELHSL